MAERILYGNHEVEWGVWVPDENGQSGSVVRCESKTDAERRLDAMRAKVPEWGARHILVKRHLDQWIRAVDDDLPIVRQQEGR